MCVCVCATSILFVFVIYNNIDYNDRHSLKIKSIIKFKQLINCILSLFFFLVPASLTTPKIDNEVISVPVGEKVELRCEARGSPLPTIYILKDIYDTTWHNQDFTNGTIERKIKRIESAQLSDAGTYVCLASNVLVGPPQRKRTITDWKTIVLDVNGEDNF